LREEQCLVLEYCYCATVLVLDITTVQTVLDPLSIRIFLHPSFQVSNPHKPGFRRLGKKNLECGPFDRIKIQVSNSQVFGATRMGSMGSLNELTTKYYIQEAYHVLPIQIDRASKVMSRFLVLFHCDQHQKKPIIFTKLSFSRCAIQAAGVVFVIQQEMPAPIPFTALCRTDHGVSNVSSCTL
jgi:hypothetical protein